LLAGSSLAEFLEKEFGKRNGKKLPSLTEGQIKEWVVEWRHKTGKYPTHISGKIPGTDETWSAVHQSLTAGRRGLPGGSSLFKFINQYLDPQNNDANV
jgi:hypothetical protein